MNYLRLRLRLGRILWLPNPNRIWLSTNAYLPWSQAATNVGSLWVASSKEQFHLDKEIKREASSKGASKVTLFKASEAVLV